MNAKLPNFKYHPNPLETKNAKEIDFSCICCGEEKNIAYSAGIYTSLDIDRDQLCLDCIYDGSAAKKFDATFTDPHYIPMEIFKGNKEEFLERTPGYISWQGQVWLSHCNNICAFHGDFDPIELQQIYQDEENKGYLKDSFGCNDQELTEIVLGYNPIKSTQPSFYKFKCLICEKVLAHTDFT
jgi:uncharacterized protein CbrC (UPF0167 family)